MPDRPSTPRPIRVAVVAADRRVRSALASLLGASGAVTLAGSFGSVSDAVPLTGTMPPDVVVLDARFPESDPGGNAAVGLLRVHAPRARILALHWPEAGAEVSVTVGADGVLDATALQPSALLDAIVLGPGAPNPAVPHPGV